MNVALITGGSCGIGLAIAQNLLKQNYRVYICSRSQHNLDSALESLSHPAASAIVADVSSSRSVLELFEQLKCKHKHLDILINSAGMSALSYIENEADQEVWHQIISTNLTGTYYCSRQAILMMKEHNFGRIINIASILGLRGMRNYYAYCAAKHGIIGFTRAIAQDVLENGITVNAICPGWVETEMGKNSMASIAHHYGISVSEFEQAEIQAIPLGRWIQAEEVASMVDFLISEQASAITGQALEISGGL